MHVCGAHMLPNICLCLRREHKPKGKIRGIGYDFVIKYITIAALTLAPKIAIVFFAPMNR